MLDRLATETEVSHPNHGRGEVLLDRGETVVVRFAHGIEEVPRSELRTDATGEATERTPLQGLLRVMAECVRSINDTWGVFSRSRIDLLPHQLWVCRRVNAQWPTRWLVADDVGLGKTIEAGLVLWPLVSRGVVRRLLILCPASLVGQWQFRLRSMFDLRCAVYDQKLDTLESDFWGTHPFVIASIETLRLDHADRRQRMLEAEPWDLLVVDEAHRLNADEERGPTLGYKLVEELRDAEKVTSMVFFTGTPHRGKNYGFLSLLQLLRPDVFDSRSEFERQLHSLREVMIRNNKQEVTDLNGKRIFLPPKVESATYSYSPTEADFYDTLTEFIASGKAYASRLGDSNGRAVMLVLISMQKLASSSVAAISAALRKRLLTFSDSRHELGELRRQRTLTEALLSAKEFARQYEHENDNEDLDRLANLDERIGDLDAKLQLMEGEEGRLRELVALASLIERETKIERIIEELRDGGRFAGRSVLFFTEYKATQALLLSRLEREFGDCCTFINGDDRLDGVLDEKGQSKVLRSRREEAAFRFNAGEIRFLIATEAGGEGIDLQRRCWSLVHVDLPWNPMRLHQRVGRLNRYGQTEQVEVLTLRNPDTVESRIWEHLNTKLIHIQKAFAGAMDDPEDILQLVLGMASPTLFRELFAEAHAHSERLGEWFDGRVGSLGGEDVVSAVKRMVGHCARFNFAGVGQRLPRVDLPDLRPFLVGLLTLLRRRVEFDANGAITFLTPDEWKREMGIRPRYDRLSFDRYAESKTDVAGAGHKMVDRALREALDFPAGDLLVPREFLSVPLHICRVRDRVTRDSEPPILLAVEQSDDGSFSILSDWQLLLRLNNIVMPAGRSVPPVGLLRPAGIISLDENGAELSSSTVREKLIHLGLNYKVPEVTTLATLWPYPQSENRPD